ncbi:hypothetical protein CANINC_002008 [Pichia inconspicua]|uniref:Tc1-like transposase DDE domain-containing protein n=1 Tax=Pichia inconspicua TaxID=52247 RepID=A0A4T0X3I7_9ASCO|nr:hypothetical protein CANINC_002008 [[Candida] inconspicua]
MGDGIKTAWSKKGVTPVCNTEKGFSDSKQSITCIGAISIAGLLCMAVKTKDNISMLNTIENSNLTIDHSDLVSHLRLLKQKYPMMSNKLFECNDEGKCTAEAYGTRRLHFMSFLWNLMLKMKTIKNRYQHKYIYLDNASIHHGITVQEMVIFFNQSYGTEFELLYGFKYSPDLNPIELYWKLLRDRYRPLGSFDNIVDRLVNAASLIPIQRIKNCINHTEKMIRLVNSFEPLCISKFSELNVSKRPIDAYKNDPSFHLIKSFDEIGGKNELKSGMISGDLVLFHIGKFGNGFRVYFRLGNSRYSCAKTLFNDDMKEWLDSAERIPVEPSVIQTNEQIPSDGIRIQYIDYKSEIVTIMDKDGNKFATRFEKLIKVYPSEILEFYLEEKNKSLKILSRRRELAEQHKKLAHEKKRLRSEKATEVLNRKTERLLTKQRKLELAQKRQETKRIQQEEMAAVKKNIELDKIRRKQLKAMKTNQGMTHSKNQQKEVREQPSKTVDQKDDVTSTNLYIKKRKRDPINISSHASNILDTTKNEPEIQEIMNITKTRRRVRFVKEGEEQIIPLESFTRKYPEVLKAYYEQNPEVRQG